jgi:hypothetical protein
MKYFTPAQQHARYRNTKANPRWTRWQLVQDRDGDGYGTASTASEGVAQGSDTPETAQALSARRYLVPETHAGWGAHWTDDDGARRCVRCETPNIQPLTFDEWVEGGGGEDRRNGFVDDYAACTAGQSTPDQLERMRLAFEDAGK